MTTNRYHYVSAFVDDARLCFESVFSLRRFSNYAFLNYTITFFSTLAFIAKNFRRLWCIWFLVSFAFTLGTVVWRFVSVAHDDIWGIDVPTLLLITSLVSLLGSFLWQALSFHKLDVYGPSTTEGRELDDRRSTEDGNKGEHLGQFHFNKVIARDAEHPVYRIPGGESGNLIEFDREISRHLIEHELRFPKTEPLFEISESEILQFSHDFHASMIRAFVIKRDDVMTKGKAFFNAQKVSLRSLSFVTEGDKQVAVGHVGTTSYYLSAMTNDIAVKEIRRSTADDAEVEFSELRPFKKIEPSTDQWTPTILGGVKALSNHVGCMVLAVSSDNIPILSKQDERANIAGNLFVLSGSGSLEYSDVFDSGADTSRSMSSFIKYGMARELLEETLDIPQSSNRKCDKMRVLDFSSQIQLAGYYRDFRRGGFPIFFGFAKLDFDYETLTTRKPPKVCLWETAKETKFSDRKADDKVAVRTPQEMISCLTGYQSNKNHRNRKVSDQVKVMIRLLEKEDVVRQHLACVLGGAG